MATNTVKLNDKWSSNNHQKISLYYYRFPLERSLRRGELIKLGEEQLKNFER
jgi:hypothetical protein